MNALPLDIRTTTDDAEELGLSVETLAECFARIKADHPTMTMGRIHYETSRFNAERAYYRFGDRPDRSLNLGEVFAAWTHARLEEIDAHWSSEMDRLLAAFVPKDPEASTMTYEEWSKAMKGLEISCGLRRTNVTKASYGMTYTEFNA